MDLGNQSEIIKVGEVAAISVCVCIQFVSSSFQHQEHPRAQNGAL
jgi:hypothetical protein